MDYGQKVETFRALHSEGVLVLPNAWDAGSAAVIARAGAKAIATTSSGVAWAVGRKDGQGMTRPEAVEQVRRIVAAVDLPVSADVEGGYDDVAATVAGVAEAGAVGVNIEDSRDRKLLSVEDAAERFAAARAAHPDVFINARTDVFLFQVGGLEDVVERAKAYAEAGADGLFVPGLVDLEVMAEVVRATALPVNAMAFPGAPSVSDFAAAGVRRVSLGGSITEAAYALAARAAEEVLTKGTYTAVEGGIDYPTMNSLF